MPRGKLPKDVMTRCTYVRMTEEQFHDLEVLAKNRKETKSDALRACLVAVVNQAKIKGLWKDK